MSNDTTDTSQKIGFWSITSIGVGGMVGGGIFAVLGLAVQFAHGGTPVAFLFAGFIALLTSYAYARLSVTYPSQGGTVEFLNQAFGTGLFTGGMNILLLLFVAVGLWTVNAQQIAPSAWSSSPRLIAGGMLIFLAYEGFELIANTATDVKKPATLLPRAYYTSVIFVILLYILVSLVTVGNLPVDKIVAAKDYALAESARPFFGQFGFTLIAIAALLSTGSAINATLYGTARVSYIIAKDGELPEFLERKIWKQPIEGLLFTSLLTLLVANLFDLSSISLMGSAGFLLIFAAVNAANLKLHEKTGSKRWISALGVLACLGAFGVLIWQTAKSAPEKLVILAGLIVASFAIEIIYKKITGRELRYIKKELVS